TLSACGGDDDTAGSEVRIARAVQQMISEQDWQNVVDDSAELATLANSLQAPWLAAGVIEGGDGRRLHWAEYGPTIEANRQEIVALFRRCDAKDACVVGTASHTDTGSIWKDASGALITELDLGTPVLHKTLKNHNLQKSETVIRLELNRKHVIDPALTAYELNQSKFGTRRAVLLNAYGAGVGMALEELRASLEVKGRFDSVETIEFARRRDLISLLPSLTNQDVLIWVGAGVLEPFSDKPAKSVGMTLSRGIFGDELIHRNHLAKLLEAPPLGGPGLVVLLGSNSLTTDHPSQTGLMASSIHQSPHRAVVGVSGKLQAADVDNVGVTLIEALFAGDTLTVAAEKAGQSAAVTITTLLTAEQSDAWKMAKGKADFWDSPPKAASLKMFVQNAPTCVVLNAGDDCNVAGFKAGNAVPAEQLTAAHVLFDCGLTFDGPWLSGTMTNEAVGTDFTLKGVLNCAEQGCSVLVHATGAPSKKMNNVTVVGAGSVTKSATSGSTLTLQFNGPAAASTYTDGEGRCCVAKSPLLQGNQSQLSVLTVGF
ncbi:MAG TPA: hypothetical protein DCQ06_01075, partial [Myxococcales bacterium]|nr:hypothetical protein [Myxococcales bacterium]